MAECEAKERKILVGVDEGEESMYALSWCLNNILVSQNSKDTLILLYAKPPRPFYMALDGTNRREVRGHMFSTNVMATMDKYTNELAEANIMATMDKYTDELAESVIEKAKRLCKEIHHLDVKVETRVETGDPRDVICQTVEKSGVDMVVLGSHGYSLITRVFLGSVSSHCAQKVKCPVLIVKRPQSTSPSK
ncbi:uncharacterized protein LOC114258637 [Camellia sinensis]|uniref:UspA domain-containing protein n=1 Tax=Camellia sinensis var. sinensis TaxID=542762 RepID=A0A4S4EXF3_CAMSN|nr:uncharacterized protein LOC114258637 [Camellia sinensis]THG21264.1 hypothetical protein TEA_019650 [Camellia sinensis var. sinensis]